MKPAPFAALLAPLLAAPASAQTVVDDPLTVAGVFLDASMLIKLVLAGLVLVVLASVTVWALELAALRKGQGANARQTFIRIVADSAPLIGLAATAYTLFNIALGVSNVRPTPPASVVAPGIAEAFLVAMLALLAGGVATALRRHLEARLQIGRSAQIAPPT